MAADVGATISLKGEKQYREQMRQITQQTKTMRAETVAMESEWNKATTAQQKATKQAKLLGNQINQQKNAIKTAEANVKRYTEAYGESDARTLKWKQTLAEAKTELTRLEGELKKVPNSLQIFGQKMENAGQKIQKVGKAVTSVGTTLTKYVTAPIVGLGTAAVKTTADFDESMSKVQALSGATGKDFDALRKKAREMGATTKYSAGESADALGYMALAGWDTNQMIDGLDGVLNLAAASGMELAEASDMVTDYLSAFGLEAKDSTRFADQLAYAQAHSNTTTTQLGDAFGNSAAQMHTAGQSMETTTAVLEAFANQGLKGSEAGTALSAMMRDITQKMKNGKIQIGDTTVAVQDQNGNFRNMIDILADVEAATDGMGSAEKSAALMTTFTARSVKGVSMALTEGTDKIYGYESALYSADGSAKKMADTMQDNLKGQLTILKSQLQELAISFGDILVPKIRKAVEWVQKQVDKFNKLDESTKKQIVKFAGLAAAIGPVLAIAGKLTTGIGKLVEGGGKALKWIGKFTKGADGLALSLNPVALGILAVAGAALAYKAGMEKIETATRNASSELYDALDASKAATDGMSAAGDELSNAFDDANESIETTIAASQRAQEIADELADLTQAHRLTADEQRRQKILVDELNGIYPELGLSIDDTTGKLNKSTEEIQKYIDEASKMAKVKAYQEAINSVTQELSEALLEQTKAEMAAEKANATYAASQSDLSKRTQELLNKKGKLTAAEKFELGQLMQGANAYTEEGRAMHEANSAQIKYNQENEKLNGQVEESNNLLDYLYEQLDALTGGMEDTAEGAEETGEAVQGMADDTSEAAEEIEDASEKIIESYIQTASSAKESAMSQSSLWEELEQKEATSLEKMRQGLLSHIQAYSSWNSNVDSITSSTYYTTDKNFRNMVDSIIAAGVDMAPELQVIADALANGDAELSELTKDYGNMDRLGSGYGDTIARANSNLEYGFKETEKVLKRAEKDVRPAARKVPESMAKGYEKGRIMLQTGTKKVLGLITDNVRAVKNQGSPALTAASYVAESIGKGYRSKEPVVNAATNLIKTTVSAGTAAIKAMAPAAQEAGDSVATAIGTGEKSGTTTSVKPNSAAMRKAVHDEVVTVGGFKTTATANGKSVASGIGSGLNAGTVNSVKPKASTMRKAVTDAVTGIGNQKDRAKTAGSNVAGSVGSGIAGKQAVVSSAASAMLEAVKNNVTGIGNLRGTAKTYAEGTAGNVATGINNKKGLVSKASSAMFSYVSNAISNVKNLDGTTAGETPTSDLATGIDNKKSDVETSATSVKNAVSLALSGVKDLDTSTWGSEMIENLRLGMWARAQAVWDAATSIAEGIRSKFHFTHPDEGPLREGTEIWGRHMIQDYAKGMRIEIPAVEKAADMVASAVAIPTKAMLNMDAVSGRNIAESPLTQLDLMEAVTAAAANIDWKVVIADREFGRILRKQGVAIA